MDLNSLAAFSQAGLFTIIFSVLGWIFVYHNSRSLARQSEVNAIILAIEKMLYELADENNKFWRDSTENDIGRSKIFIAYISFRCNFIEEKLRFLNEKAESIWRSDINHSAFENDVIDIIAEIRDRATMDSEQPKQVDDRISRVLEINHLSEKMYETIYDFLRLRYMDSDSKFRVKIW